jgi:hypothetical protein
MAIFLKCNGGYSKKIMYKERTGEFRLFFQTIYNVHNLLNQQSLQVFTSSISQGFSKVKIHLHKNGANRKVKYVLHNSTNKCSRCVQYTTSLAYAASQQR